MDKYDALEILLTYFTDDNYFEITDIINNLKSDFGEEEVTDCINKLILMNAASQRNVKAYNHYLIHSPITRELMTNPCHLIVDNQISRNNFDFHSLASWFVKPCVKSNKNDAAAIAEAVPRSDMRFVPMKTVAQQDMLLAHRVRELAIKERTALGNQIRGLLVERGIIVPQTGFLLLSY